MKNTMIDGDVLAVLRDATMVGCNVQLPGQLDRRLYLRVDKVLQELGGRWDRKARAHVFPSEARACVEDAIEAGAFRGLKDTYQWFQTPAEVAERLVDALSIPTSGSFLLLEPSAGDGAILRKLAAQVPVGGLRVVANEIDKRHEAPLTAAMQLFPEAHLIWVDFLTTVPSTPPIFDFVLMNPPFSEGRAVAHVNHAMNFLRPGGRLAAVVPSGVQFRQDKAHTALRNRVLESGGSLSPLPPESFRQAGTDAATLLLTYTKE